MTPSPHGACPPLPSRRRALAAAGAGAAAAALAACSSDDAGAGSGKEGPAADFEERGPITLAMGKDTTGKLKEFLERWNTDHEDEKVTLTELPESADEQRTQLINNAQAKSDAYAVLGLDVVWVAEFAANGWVVELPEDTFALDTLIPTTVETAKYFDKLYSVPFATGAQLLFSRTDLLKKAGLDGPPKTFEEMYDAIETLQKDDPKLLGFGSQYSKYEGLTVQTTNVISSAGGELFDKDGTPHADSTEAVTALQTVRDGFEKGFIPQEALTYKEEETRQAFQDGRLAFMENWLYVWDLLQAEDGSSEVSGKIEASVIPGFGGKSRSALGGLNYAVSSFAKNKGTALDFIAFMVEPKQQQQWAAATSQPPTNEEVYGDQELAKKLPFLPVLKEAIDNGVSRPSVVKYGDVTQAIQEAAYGALSGTTEVEPALKDLQKTLTGLTKE